MEFTQAVRTCLFSKFATFKGRATRSEFWWFQLFLVILDFVLSGILAIVYLSFLALFTAMGLPAAGFVFGIIFVILCALTVFLLIIPEFAVLSRRLHDRDMSAWWLLLLLLPTFGIIAILIIAALPGTRGPNRYGEDVHENEYNTYRDFKYDRSQNHDENTASADATRLDGASQDRLDNDNGTLDNLPR